MNYFRYKQFNKDVITVAVGYYLRYALSYRDISEIVHTEDSFLLKLYYKFNFATEPKKLSRYPQLYSRIGFAHEFDNLSKDETHHILEYKWQDLGFDLKLEDFTDYEAITTIIKITKGNFRLIHRLFAQIDRIMDINGLDKISTEVVETARDSLVIGIR